MARKILLEHKLAPGDVVATTSLVRDIKLTYGDDVILGFNTNFPAIYEHNPHIVRLDKNASDVEHVVLCYSAGITSAGKGHKHHFITWHYRDFTNKTGMHVPCLYPRPDLHLSEYEKRTRPVSGRYWLVLGGGKTDMTTKHWDFKRYQEAVDRLRGYGLRFAQTGATKPGNVHPPMTRVLNLVGWGYVRQLMWQIAHCEGVIAPITCAMHMAAAFQKPCVVIAGGREEPWWEEYSDMWGAFGSECAPTQVPHRYLHTMGQLECCMRKGCWRNKTVKINNDNSVCHQLAKRDVGAQPLPECMDMITVDHVVEAVMSYYEDGTLPPIGQPLDEESRASGLISDQPA